VAVSAGAAAGCGADVPSGSGVEVAASGALSSAPSSASYLVSFVDGVIPANADSLIASAGGSVAARYLALGVVLARSSQPSFAQALRAAPGVDGVGAVTAASSRLAPKSLAAPRRGGQAQAPRGGTPDPLAFCQWDMDQIHAPAARAITTGSKSVLVSVLDSGVDVTHADLVGQVDGAASASCLGGVPNADPAVWSNDIIGHGTHVSGTIAALSNRIGIVGVAPGVRLAAVKVAVDDVNDPNFGLVLPDAFVCAIDWSINHGADLMNASLSIDPFTAPIDDIFCSDQPDREAVVKIVRRAVLEAGRRKVSLVAATGNFFTDLSTLQGTTPGSHCKVLPVQLPRVIGVSAVGYTRQLSFYSNYGFGAVDLAGPGGDSLVPDAQVTDTAASGQVLSSMPPGSLFYQAAADYNGQVQDCSAGPCATYGYLQGTSQAAPHVTGVAALVISRYGKLSPDALLVKLSLGATPLACPPSPYDPGDTGQPATCTGPAFYNNFYGAGEVDALAAVR
jgi:subtilisin family serine protease